MRTLLFGKNGLLGSEIVKVLQKKDGFDATFLGHHEADITDSRQVEEWLSKIKPDLVINATGYTNVDKAEEETELAMRINGYAVEELAKICGEKNTALMHFSTDYVFQGNQAERSEAFFSNHQGYDENANSNPLNVYGKSKAFGEALLMKNTDKFFLIRSQWLFGKGGRNFTDAILNQAKTQQTLRVVNDQFGKPTWAKDLAEALLPFFNSLNYGIYHIVNEGVTSWFEYAKEILKLAGIEKEVIPITSEELNRPAKRPKFSALVNTKLPKLRPWKEALQEYISSIS